MEELSLHFLGTGSAFNVKLGNNSAYLKCGKEMVLFDCGGTVFERIMEKDLLKDIEKIHIFITHLHPDHVGSLGDLIFYCHYAANTIVSLYYPSLSIINLLDMLGVNLGYNHYPAGGEDQFFLLLDGLSSKTRVSIIKQTHGRMPEAFGYLFEGEFPSFFYSGDSKTINPLILEKLKSGELAKLYQDVSSYDIPQNPHLSFDGLLALIPHELRSKVYCMHLDEKFDVESAKKEGFNVV